MPDNSRAPGVLRAEVHTSTPAEMRLKRLIESAPVSIVVASPDGTVLAANRETLTLVGVNRVEDLIGTDLADCVAAEQRDRFRGFVKGVCGGESATLEYELAGRDRGTVFVETRAVPLTRPGITPAAFLSVTWDITAWKRAATAGQPQSQARCDLLEAQLQAQRETYEAALREAKSVYDDLRLERAAERKTLGDTIRDARVRLQERLAEAEEHHERLAVEWGAEREALLARLRESEERQTTLATQTIADQNARQLATLEALEVQHQAALSAKSAEHERLEMALDELRARIIDLEAKRSAERQQYESAVREERRRTVVLLDEREQWQRQLTELLRTLTKTSSADELLNRLPAQSEAFETLLAADSESAGDSRWGF